jgi:hypothetical protein
MFEREIEGLQPRGSRRSHDALQILVVFEKIGFLQKFSFCLIDDYF